MELELVFVIADVETEDDGFMVDDVDVDACFVLEDKGNEDNDVVLDARETDWLEEVARELGLTKPAEETETDDNTETVDGEIDGIDIVEIVDVADPVFVKPMEEVEAETRDDVAEVEIIVTEEEDLLVSDIVDDEAVEDEMVAASVKLL